MWMTFALTPGQDRGGATTMAAAAAFRSARLVHSDLNMRKVVPGSAEMSGSDKLIYLPFLEITHHGFLTEISSSRHTTDVKS